MEEKSTKIFECAEKINRCSGLPSASGSTEAIRLNSDRYTTNINGKKIIGNSHQFESCIKLYVSENN